MCVIPAISNSAGDWWTWAIVKSERLPSRDYEKDKDDNEWVPHHRGPKQEYSFPYVIEYELVVQNGTLQSEMYKKDIRTWM